MLVIEMNPRVSRSSALASKATGYPIAKVAAKLALGYTLDELNNALTENTIPASFEPSIDYVVTKLPRFNFEKFSQCDGVLTTKMQSTGEVIGIGRNFQESLLKAICSVEKNFTGLRLPSLLQSSILDRISKPYHDRLFYIAEAFREGWSVVEVNKKTGIDPWFLDQIYELIELEKIFKNKNLFSITEKDFYMLKRKGFSDQFEGNYAQNYQYLAWLLGNEPVVDRQKLIYTIVESSPDINIIKEIR